jgi:hypothetical protein
MSLFEMDQVNARDEDIPTKWRDMDGKKVILIGETWAPDGANGARSFELCYSIANCCFGGPPKVQHFVFAKVVPEKPDAPVGVGDTIAIHGILHVGVQRDSDTGKVLSIYRIDVTDVTHVH